MMTSEVVTLRHRGFAIVALGDFNAKVGQIPGLENNKPDLNTNTPLCNTFTNSIHGINLYYALYLKQPYLHNFCNTAMV